MREIHCLLSIIPVHQLGNEMGDVKTYKELLEKRQRIEEELIKLEQQIHKLEMSYLEETWAFGNVLKGFDGYLSNRSRPSSSQFKKTRFKETDRLFSYSSYTSAKVRWSTWTVNLNF